MAGFFARREDPYAGADLSIAITAGVAAWLVNAVVASVVVVVAASPERLGAGGWGLAGVAVAASVLAGVVVGRRGERNTADQLLTLSYLGVVDVFVLQWLTGGNDSPLVSLYLLWTVYTAAVHPPRRTAAFLGFVALASAGSLAYDGWQALAASALGIDLLLWFSLALLATLWTSGVRAQRLGLSQDEAQARNSARTDPLTGLGNRRAFDEALDAEVGRAQLSRQPLSILLGDLNDFKRINDRFGHLNGDQCLRDVAAAVCSVLRDLDRCFRWGGDEFAVLLPDTDRAGAEDLAVRLHNNVSGSCSNPDGEPLAILTGSAEFRAGMSRDELLGEADLALMGAKSRSMPVDSGRALR